MITKLLNFRTKTITQGALLLVGSSLLSGALGVLRDRLLASGFGAGTQLDAYFAAFRVPDFLYNLLILGGVSAVFLPMFAEYMAKNKEEAWKFVNNLLHATVLFIGFLALIAVFFAPLLARLVAPGFGEEQQELMVSLVRVMLLSPILFAVSSVFSGILQYFSRFLWYALAPVAYNLGIIGGIVFLAPSLGILGVALGVVAGAALHIAIQVPALLLSGFSWKPLLQLRDAGIQKALRLALPRTVGGAAYHLNLVAMTAFASLFPIGSLTALNFADRFQQLPFNFLAIPFAISAFPVLSRLFAQRKKEEFQKELLQTLRKVGLLALPLAFLLFFFRDFWVNLVLRAGKFTEADAELTASLLGMFAVGVIFQAFIPLLIRAFYALQDTKTPTVVSIATVVFNIALAFFLINRGGSILVLPLSLVLSGMLQSALLLFLLQSKVVSSFKS